jgi:hypothetical protein
LQVVKDQNRFDFEKKWPENLPFKSSAINCAVDAALRLLQQHGSMIAFARAKGRSSSLTTS